jgi:ubiquinone/menaquinone biosynthesis C-methylase UbiE
MSRFNPEFYDIIAREVFAPIYPYIAAQALKHSGISTGVCLDAGCGGGYLGLALAGMSDLSFYFLDSSADMIAFAEKNIAEKQMQERARAILSDITAIPLDNESVDLVISRGSVFFWPDLAQAFKEIFRVLKPGGYAFIGGGLGTPEMRQNILDEMKKRDPDWKPHFSHKDNNGDVYDQALSHAGITGYTATRDDSGFWITFRK